MRPCPVISLTVWDNAVLRMTLTLCDYAFDIVVSAVMQEREKRVERELKRGYALGEGGFQASLSPALTPWKREEGDILICGLCWSAGPICSANMHYKNMPLAVLLFFLAQNITEENVSKKQVSGISNAWLFSCPRAHIKCMLSTHLRIVLKDLPELNAQGSLGKMPVKCLPRRSVLKRRCCSLDNQFT